MTWKEVVKHPPSFYHETNIRPFRMIHWKLRRGKDGGERQRYENEDRFDGGVARGLELVSDTNDLDGTNVS
jgi:hypothetical protein